MLWVQGEKKLVLQSWGFVQEKLNAKGSVQWYRTNMGSKLGAKIQEI